MPKVLIVDDEPNNLRILDRLLKEHDFETVKAEDGAIAWDYINKHPNQIDLILLDRMMPNMDGMQFMEHLRKAPKLSDIPVIMQTAASANDQVREGIEAGVYYYLSKPFDEEVLLAVVNSALSHAEQERALKKEIKKNQMIVGHIRMAQFMISNIREAYNLSYFIANYFPSPDKAVVGLYALMVNAIEHGNLGINYERKAELAKNKGAWHKEIDHLLKLPENKDKQVDVRYGNDGDEIKIYIKDEGEGFNAFHYMNIDPSRATHSNGRGIALAKKHSFDTIEYLGNGNEVLCKVQL